MAIELGMVNVTVRRDSLRRLGEGDHGLIGIRIQDEHITNFAFMSSIDAHACVERLLALGLVEGQDIADQTSDWLETGTWRDGFPIFHLRHAWLRGTDPFDIVEMAWLKEKRDKVPGPRPWFVTGAVKG